jgi:flagellin-like hook-associated protein FlgL
VLQIDAAGGGNLTVREVGGGHTAQDLGIFRDSGLGTAPIVGEDVNPQVTLTTRLEDLLGVRAEAFLAAPGANNDLVIRARDRGPELNGTLVRFVDDSLLQAAPLTAGDEIATYAPVARPARASLALSGPDNDLILTAVSPGTAMNGVSIVLDASANLGDAATVSYDPGAKVLTLRIDDDNETRLGTLASEIDAQGIFTVSPDPSALEGYDPLGLVNSADAAVVTGTTDGGADPGTLLIRIRPGQTTANHVVAAIEADPLANSLFSVQLDEDDTYDPASAGTGKVRLPAQATLAGGSGIELDQSSGIQVVNGGRTHVLTFENADTVEDLLNIMNGSEAGLWAEINEDASGINLFSRLSGADFQIGENGGTTATDLGIRSLTEATKLADLNHGLGVHSEVGTDFTIRRRDGVVLDIDTSSAETIQDVLGLVNDHPNNQTATGFVVAQLSQYGNGIELVEDSPLGPVDPVVIPSFGHVAARDLGLATSATAPMQLPAPNDANTGFVLGANSPGPAGNGVEVVFLPTLVGDLAHVTFDGAANQLQVEIDPTQTTTNTILGAVAAEGTFRAWLETEGDPTNDGTGTFTATGGLAITDGGIDSTDPNPLEVEGVFNSLLRLSQAIEQTDVIQIERAVAQLDDDMERARFAQAESGARVRSLDLLQQRLTDEEVELKQALSLELDVDLVAAVSELTARQTAFEASLRSAAQIFSLSLLDFL